MVDKPYLYEYKQNSYELLFRTLLLKAVTLKAEKIFTFQDKRNSIYGFKPYRDNLMIAGYKDIIFPETGGCCERY
jgi:hypothetical protein